MAAKRIVRRPWFDAARSKGADKRSRGLSLARPWHACVDAISRRIYAEISITTHLMCNGRPLVTRPASWQVVTPKAARKEKENTNDYKS